MSKKPRVVLTSRDVQRLETLLDSLSGSHPGVDALEEELVRAEVVEPAEIPPEVVTMHSTVHFQMAASGKEFELTLVYPKDVDDSGKQVSILAPVGSALLGLSAGDTLHWPGPGGTTTEVNVVDVVYQPERAGEYHR